MNLKPAARDALKNRILKDCAWGQTAADVMAQRIKIPADLCEQLCEELVAENKLQTGRVMDRLTVYRLR